MWTRGDSTGHSRTDRFGGAADLRGIVFTELMEMVESTFGLAIAQQVIDHSGVPSKGVYTSVGSYDHTELLRLVASLAALTATPATALTKAFGRHLFGRFAILYPQFFAGVEGPLEFLEAVDGLIHVEVRKLYPNAQLPRFESRRRGPDELELDYVSPRPFADLAEGLIEGCTAHFGRGLRLERRDVAGARGPAVRFTVQLLPVEVHEQV